MDDTFIVESILEMKLDQNKSEMYLVKWHSFPREAATWEPSSNLPGFIISYYKKNISKLGQPLPNPRIKHTKTTSEGAKYYFLTWEGETGGSWLEEDFFKLAEDNEFKSFCSRGVEIGEIDIFYLIVKIYIPHAEY